MKKIFLLLFLTLILTTSLASAQCFSVRLSRESYLAGETFQAEISGTLEKPLTIEDIRFLKGNKEYFPAFNLEQVANDKWVVWMKVPSNYGESRFEVKGLCKEQILEDRVVLTDFLIQKSLQDAYSWLRNQVFDKWPLLSSDETALALTVLSYDPDLFATGKTSLLSKGVIHTCWPLPCEVKSTSFSAIALKDQSQKEQIKDWLLDSENNIKSGIWNLNIDSSTNQTCNLGINEANQSISLTKGINPQILLELPDTPEIKLNLDCAINSAILFHTHLGEVNGFALTPKDGLHETIINNAKCWGEKYRTDCNPESTAYALLALRELGITNLQNEINWLGQNLQTTTQRAIYYSFTSDEATKNLLINNQAQQGYWSKEALAVSDIPDIESTVTATKYLTGESKLKGENWLRALFEETGSFGNIKETSQALQLFSQDKIGPLIDSTGLVKITSGKDFSIKFSNNGVLGVKLTTSLFSQQKMLDISPLASGTLTFTAPIYSRVTFTEALVTYTTDIPSSPRTYKIPVVVFPSGIGIGELINGTSSEGALFESDIKFIPEEISSTVGKGRTQFNFEIKNLDSTATEVSLSIFGLSDIIEKLEPASFESLPGQSQDIELIFNTENAFGTYSGKITADSAGSAVSLPINLEISEEVETEPIIEKETVEEKEPFKLNKKAIGWTMIVLAVILAALSIYLKFRKKPEKPIKVALEKARPNYLNPLKK